MVSRVQTVLAHTNWSASTQASLLVCLFIPLLHISSLFCSIPRCTAAIACVSRTKDKTRCACQKEAGPGVLPLHSPNPEGLPRLTTFKCSDRLLVKVVLFKLVPLSYILMLISQNTTKYPDRENCRVVYKNGML